MTWGCRGYDAPTVALAIMAEAAVQQQCRPWSHVRHMHRAVMNTEYRFNARYCAGFACILPTETATLCPEVLPADVSAALILLICASKIVGVERRQPTQMTGTPCVTSNSAAAADACFELTTICVSGCHGGMQAKLDDDAAAT